MNGKKASWRLPPARLCDAIAETEVRERSLACLDRRYEAWFNHFVKSIFQPILPGSAIGVLGSGQLGRMFAIAARRMGYRVHTFSPETDTPTGQVADVEVKAHYDDLMAVRGFASDVDVVTFEFENVPAATAQAAAECAPV